MSRHRVLTEHPAWRAFEVERRRQEEAIADRRRELHDLEEADNRAAESWRRQCAEADAEGRAWPPKPTPDPNASVLAEQVQALHHGQIVETPAKRREALVAAAPEVEEGAREREATIRDELAAGASIATWQARSSELESLRETVSEVRAATVSSAGAAKTRDRRELLDRYRKADDQDEKGRIRTALGQLDPFGGGGRPRTRAAPITPEVIFGWILTGQPESLIGLVPVPEAAPPPRGREPTIETVSPRETMRRVTQRLMRADRSRGTEI
jgi:hypothetical protein